MAEGFLGRWSQRKQAQRVGKALDEPVTPSDPVVMGVPDANDSAAGPRPVLVQAPPETGPTGAAGAAGSGRPTNPAEVAPLSLDDVQRLTTESDFKPFVTRSVSPEVRNAAMKKLFTDPRYNVMDRLDIYIDDYSQPDPLPQSMLRQMVSAKFLNLFEEEKDQAPPLGDVADTRSANSVAQSAQPLDPGVQTPLENLPQAPAPDHDHTDLRLQPNDAAGRPQPGRGTQ